MNFKKNLWTQSSEISRPSRQKFSYFHKKNPFFVLLIYKYEHKNFLGRVKTLIITKFQNPDFHNKNADFCFVHLLIQNQQVSVKLF